jgi:hypothetical protein
MMVVVSGFWRNDRRKLAPGAARTLEECQNFGDQHHPAYPSKPILDHGTFGTFCHPCRGEAKFPGAVPVVAPSKKKERPPSRMSQARIKAGQP